MRSLIAFACLTAFAAGCIDPPPPPPPGFEFSGHVSLDRFLGSCEGAMAWDDVCAPCEETAYDAVLPSGETTRVRQTYVRRANRDGFVDDAIAQLVAGYMSEGQEAWECDLMVVSRYAGRTDRHDTRHVVTYDIRCLPTKGRNTDVFQLSPVHPIDSSCGLEYGFATARGNVGECGPHARLGETCAVPGTRGGAMLGDANIEVRQVVLRSRLTSEWVENVFADHVDAFFRAQARRVFTDVPAGAALTCETERLSTKSVPAQDDWLVDSTYLETRVTCWTPEAELAAGQ